MGMNRISRFRRVAPLLALTLLAIQGRLHGQSQAVDTLARAGWSALPLPGSVQEDRDRVAQFRGLAPTAGWLLRTPSSRLPMLAGSGTVRWELLAPQGTLTYNDRIPFSLNDGALWAGRGINATITGGARIGVGRLSLTLAPELLYSQNQHSETFAPADTALSLFASRWHVGPHSADLPQRFGNESLATLRPGQSVLEADLGAVHAGASTENQWWGPGIHNAIVMSSQAEGIPHLFARTGRPLRTPIGAVEARWIAGGLVESLYFDTISTNDVRPLSGIVATLAVAAEPNLTLGVARVVYSRGGGAGDVPARAFDVFTWWDRPPLEADSADVAADSAAYERDQILSLFARWVFPDDGFELYGEWSRAVLPSSFSDFINQPNHTQAYTLGVQWARPVQGEDVVRLQSELSYLEESPASITRPGKPYYVSETIVQGYTHRGQVVGAAIGPGGSSQWVAGDYLANEWQAGLFLGRIRWDNDVYYDPGRISYVAHDVSVFGGVRGGRRVGRSFVLGEITTGQRYNYRFQNPENNPWGNGALDIWNTTLRLTVTPLPRRVALTRYSGLRR